MKAAPNPWFRLEGKRERPALRLFCFPYAGGGPSVFAGWADRLPASVEVVGVRLPGRENRFRERPYRAWAPLLEDLEALMRGVADLPFAFFGHSLGGRIAYELAKRLGEAGCRVPDQVIVSGCRAPGVAQRGPLMHAMTTPDLRRRLEEMQGVPQEILGDDRIMNLLEPMLRADLELAEIWAPPPVPIPSPIAALCGARDRIDPPEVMRPWSGATSGGFDYLEFEGGHFFIHDNATAVLAAIAGLLERRLDGKHAEG